MTAGGGERQPEKESWSVGSTMWAEEEEDFILALRWAPTTESTGAVVTRVSSEAEGLLSLSW